MYGGIIIGSIIGKLLDYVQNSKLSLKTVEIKEGGRVSVVCEEKIRRKKSKL